MRSKLLLKAIVASLILALSAACSAPADNAAETTTTASTVLVTEAATSGEETDAPVETTAPTADVLDGYLEHQGVSYTIQYPETWVAVNQETLTALMGDTDDSLKEFYGEENYNSLKALLGSGSDATVDVYLFDFNNSTENFTPNINIIASNSGGLTLDNLKDPATLSLLQSTFTSMYADYGFTVTRDMEMKQYGGNFFATYEYDLSGLNGYLAMTISGDTQYIITASSYAGGLDIPTYEKMLATFKVSA